MGVTSTTKRAAIAGSIVLTALAAGAPSASAAGPRPAVLSTLCASQAATPAIAAVTALVGFETKGC
jgi:hypothetical protein